MHWASRPGAVIFDISLRRQTSRISCASARWIHYDGRQRLSNFWMPTSAPPKKSSKGSVTESKPEDANVLLLRGGFLRQAYSGIFHFLPLGLRVQEKLERLIDKHMTSVGASKVSLSTISSQDLWDQSGRLSKGSEFFKFIDRKEAAFLLSPTHEEEITQLVARELKSYRDLPIRLYQVSRKYRDEKRPRQGLLRGREFLMKDLYTFDADEIRAHATYEEVRGAYNNFFDELKVPYLVANADSGAMGGDLSHEYHFPSEKGEDDVISCDTCDHVRNEELVDMPQAIEVFHDTIPQQDADDSWHLPPFPRHVSHWQGVTTDGLGSIDVFIPKSYEVNLYAIQALVPDLDPSGGSKWIPDMEQDDLIIDSIPDLMGQPYRLAIFDHRITDDDRQTILETLSEGLARSHNGFDLRSLDIADDTGADFNLTKPVNGDTCPKCETGKLSVQKAIEVGHTFHLGTRYSDPLNATIAVDPSTSSNTESGEQAIVPVQMGCHGIGISRLISAVASVLVDSTGLNWPRVMAPFEVIVVPGKGLDDDAVKIYDQLRNGQDQSSSVGPPTMDVVLDDRQGKDLPWKLKDADLIGFPIIVVLGRAFAEGKVEVQCRRLGVKENVHIEELPEFVQKLLGQL